jgi:thiol:disulfide interchange protein DsbD
MSTPIKKLVLISLICLSGYFASAQSPVSWAFSTKKINDKTFELHLTATMQPGWHLYSQKQPADAIAMPTTFTFNSNPLLIFDGKVKEVGKLQKFKDDKLDISAYQYSKSVNFVQQVKLKGNAKTNVTGKLQYQTCNDEKCLPPKTVNFSLALK